MSSVGATATLHTVTLGAYTAVDHAGRRDLATVDVPKHYYYSRWRWQSAPRPVTATVADLLAAKLVPHLDKAMVSRWQACPGMATMARQWTTQARCRWRASTRIWERPASGTTSARDGVGSRLRDV